MKGNTVNKPETVRHPATIAANLKELGYGG